MKGCTEDRNVFRFGCAEGEKSEYIKDSGNKMVGWTCLAMGCRDIPKWGVWCDQHRPYKPVEKEHKP